MFTAVTKLILGISHRRTESDLISRKRCLMTGKIIARSGLKQKLYYFLYDNFLVLPKTIRDRFMPLI